MTRSAAVGVHLQVFLEGLLRLWSSVPPSKKALLTNCIPLVDPVSESIAQLYIEGI